MFPLGVDACLALALLPPPSHYHEGRFRPASAFGMRARVPQSLDVGVGEPGSAPPRFRSLLLLSTETGVHALRIEANGKVTPVATKWNRR